MIVRSELDKRFYDFCLENKFYLDEHTRSKILKFITYEKVDSYTKGYNKIYHKLVKMKKYIKEVYK